MIFACIASIFLFRNTIFEQLCRLEVVQKTASGMLGIEPADLDVADTGGGYYAFSTLTSEEQLVYNQMAQCIFNWQSQATLSTNDQSVVDKSFQCLLSDHPEIFWFSSYELSVYRFSGMDFECVFRPDYTMTKKQVEQYQQGIDAYVQTCLSGLPAQADDYEKAKYLYEYIILHTEYDKTSENNQNICSVFLNQKSVCMGYSKAYQYLLQQLGIEAAVIAGHSESETHAWNLVKLAGEYYYMDPTWGDPEFQTGSVAGGSYVDYNFFGMTTKQLLLTHTIENAFEVPDCRQTNCNYFVREGLYLSAFQEEEAERMMEKSLQNQNYASIQCKDKEVYKQLYEYFITESNIRSYIKGTHVNYVENENYHTLTIFKPEDTADIF